MAHLQVQNGQLVTPGFGGQWHLVPGFGDPRIMFHVNQPAAAAVAPTTPIDQTGGATPASAGAAAPPAAAATSMWGKAPWIIGGGFALWFLTRKK